MNENTNYTTSINPTTESHILFDIDNSSTNLNTQMLTRSTTTDLFEPITSIDQPQIEVDIVKSDNYSSLMTDTIKSIDDYECNASSYSNYPYYLNKKLSRFIPKLSKPSEILTEHQLKELHANLPYYQQDKDIFITYSLSKDGSSIKTLYANNEGNNNLIMIAKDDNQNVFGAYVSENLHYRPGKFYGTGETFLFSFFDHEKIYCFLSTGENDNYIYSDYDQIAFGCSNNYFSLSFDSNLYKGYSRPTSTYKNPSLTLSDSFVIMKLEVLSFKQ